jgi:hypothetical protein
MVGVFVIGFAQRQWSPLDPLVDLVLDPRDAALGLSPRLRKTWIAFARMIESRFYLSR